MLGKAGIRVGDEIRAADWVEAVHRGVKGTTDLLASAEA
jgi:hypothetical protein